MRPTRYATENMESTAARLRSSEFSMKRTLFIFLLIAVAFSASAQTVLKPDSNISIAMEGEVGDTDIVLEHLLKKYLLKSLGKATLEGEGDSVEIVVTAKWARWQDIPPESLPSLADIDAIDIDTTTPGVIRITGATALATGFAVMEFLEHEIGVFWLFPGEPGEVVPVRSEIVIPSGKRRLTPDVTSRIYTGIYGRNVYGLPLKGGGLNYRLRMFFWSDDHIKSLRLRHLAAASHNMINIFPVVESREKHPEIFPIKDGKRHFPDPDSVQFAHGEHWHPCYTHPKTISVATEKAIAYFDARSDLTFSLGINDGTRLQCDCENCRAAGWPQSYYGFVTAVANNVKKVYPGYQVGVLSYGDVSVPPDDLVLPDNVVVLSADPDDWVGKTTHLSIYEYLYGLGFWHPNFPLAAIKKNAKTHRKLGVSGLYAEVHPLWAFDGPKVYIRSKLLWDLDFDVEAGIDRWCRAGFGNAWPPMAAFYRHWGSLLDGDKHRAVVLPMCDFERFRHSTAQFSRLTKPFMKKAREHLREAARLSEAGPERERIKMVDTFFRHTETLHAMYYLRRRIFDGSQPQDFIQLTRWADELFRRNASELQAMKEHPEWFTGSNQDLEKIQSLTWEGRYEWSLDYEMESAHRTAVFLAGKDLDPASLSESFKIYRSPHTAAPLPLKRIGFDYYHDHLYNQLDAEVVDHELRFRKTPDASIHVPADSPPEVSAYSLSGLKKYVYRGSTPLEQDQHYLFEFDLTARNGTLTIRVHNENDAGKKIWLVEELGEKPTRVKKRMLLRPVQHWGTQEAKQRPVTVWEVEIVLDPDGEDVDINGACKVSRVDFTVGRREQVRNK